jgi:hypothetical protein
VASSARDPSSCSGSHSDTVHVTDSEGQRASHHTEYLRLSALGRRQGIRHGLPCSGVVVIAWEASESGYPRRIGGVVTAELAGPGRKCSDGTGRHGVVAGFRRPWSSRVPTAGVSRPGGRARVRLMTVVPRARWLRLGPAVPWGSGCWTTARSG